KEQWAKLLDMADDIRVHQGARRRAEEPGEVRLLIRVACGRSPARSHARSLASHLASDARRRAWERAQPRDRDRRLALVASSVGADAETLKGVEQPLRTLYEPRSGQLVI